MSNSIAKKIMIGLITLESIIFYHGCQIGNGKPPKGIYIAVPDSGINAPKYSFYGTDSITQLWNGIDPSIVFKDRETGKFVEVYNNRITVTNQDSNSVTNTTYNIHYNLSKVNDSTSNNNTK